MPFLNLRTGKGLLSDEQNKYLMEKFTELPIETEGGGNPEFRKMVWIQIEEEEPKHWQLGELRPSPEFIAGFVQQRNNPASFVPTSTRCVGSIWSNGAYVAKNANWEE